VIKLFQEEEFHWIECGAKTDRGFKRNIIIDLDEEKEIKKFKEKYNNTGIYETAYRYNNSKQSEATLYGNFYLDFDSDYTSEGFEKVKEDVLVAISFLKAVFFIEPECIDLYFSGKKGIHLVVDSKIMGIEPHENLNDIFKIIAKDICNLSRNKTVDLRIYDRVRLIRIANSRHEETGLFKTWVGYRELIDSKYEEIKEKAKSKRIENKTIKKLNFKSTKIYKEYIKQWERSVKAKWGKEKQKNTLDFCPPCIQHLLDNGANQGKRNNTLAVLCSYYKQRGLSEEEAHKEVSNWNLTKCVPPIRNYELESTLKSIYQREHFYGCKTLEEISICVKDKCVFGKNR